MRNSTYNVNFYVILQAESCIELGNALIVFSFTIVSGLGMSGSDHMGNEPP